jgi:hypothetical protein
MTVEFLPRRRGGKYREAESRERKGWGESSGGDSSFS